MAQGKPIRVGSRGSGIVQSDHVVDCSALMKHMLAWLGRELSGLLSALFYLFARAATRGQGEANRPGGLRPQGGIEHIQGLSFFLPLSCAPHHQPSHGVRLESETEQEN